MAEAQVGHRVMALEDGAWEVSQWISAVNAPVIRGKVYDFDRAADGASWFVTTIANPKEVTSAKWMATSLGIHDIYVNGQLVGDEVLKPGFTHPDKTKYSFTYDITDAISTAAGAENQYSAQVTPGWWADKIITYSGHDGMIGDKCAFRAVLELTFADGTKQLYGTDTSAWKAGISGPVKHAAIFDGEEYDARISAPCAQRLFTPEINTEFKGEILPSAGAEVYFRNDLALSPRQTYVWQGVENASADAYGRVIVKREYASGETIQLNPGENLVIDFGQNCAAVPSFLFQAPEGTRLVCEPAELLNDGNGAKERDMDGPEGSVHRRNLRIPNHGMVLDYTFADSQEPVAFIPRNTFYGYRYVSISADRPTTIYDIKSVPVSSITADMEIGSITTGNESINQLISNTLWGQRSNYLSVPTDCPQRNERLGWTADTQVFAITGSFFANTDDFFHKWMRDLRDTQHANGAYPGVAPTGQYGSGEYMRLGWADAGVIVPWSVWRQFADTDIIDSNWESMERYMDKVNSTKYDHNANQADNFNYQWGDWLSYEPLESCGGGAFDKTGPLPEAVDYWNYLGASYWAIDAEMMSDMAVATGRDASKYQQMAADAKQYLKDKFLTAEGTFKTEILNTMQTPALFALRNGLVEGQAREDMIARLRANFAEHDNCLQTGFLGTSILMNTLTDNGMGDIAYELLFQRKNPSWLYSIDNGATTIWERWNSYMLDKGMGPNSMNSFNHYAYGCVCEWLWQTAAGIKSDPAAPGFKNIIMSPMPDPRLGSLTAEYQSAAGLIKSAWRYDGPKWTWTFTIPAGSTATVTLPGATKSKTYRAGTHTLTCKL
ncbi:MAG: glycoside hydrolase family 78 protein [Bacteroidales bacterium]|nr:glycoside hydrolase family 78 protein [Bacteroidales bacterium]